MTDQQHYRQTGYHQGQRAFSTEQAEIYHRAFLAYRESNREELERLIPREQAGFLVDTHFFLRWVYDMVTYPRILDAVAAAIGPDIMLWSTQWFPKMPGDRAFVSWHQDAAYWGLSPPLVTTAWIALTPATQANGCLRVLPESHLIEYAQRETYGEDNMLSRGQEIAVDVDEDATVDLTLDPGEFSLHHVAIVHGSKANSSDIARIGIAARFVAPQVVQKSPLKDMVMLVRGRDDYGNFDVTPPPVADGRIDNCPARDESFRRKVANLGPTGDNS